MKKILMMITLCLAFSFAACAKSEGKTKVKTGKSKMDGFIYVEGDENIASFYMDKFEVTQKDYKAIMKENPSRIKNDAGTWPVVDVDFYKAIDYCNKLSIAKGLTPCYAFNGSTEFSYDQLLNETKLIYDKYRQADYSGPYYMSNFNLTCDFDANGYRLPSKEEWLYAAHSGRYYDDYDYVGSNEKAKVYVDSYNLDNKKLHEGGTKQPNKLGLYDMCGNTDELVWAVYRGNWYESELMTARCDNWRFGEGFGRYSTHGGEGGLRLVRTAKK